MKQTAQILGIDDMISGTPISNRIVLQSSGHNVLLPANCGHDGATDIFCQNFPRESRQIQELFGTVKGIWNSRQMRDLRDFTPLEMNISRYNAITVREFCDGIGLSRTAETAAGSYAACHGSPPTDAPMSFHAHIGFSLYDSLARPNGGGNAVIRAFQREAAKLGITIRTRAELTRFSEPDLDGICRNACFADGTALPVDDVFFTIHPFAVRELMPENMLTPLFQRRIQRLQETTSFFCVYYLADDNVELPIGLTSYFSENDLDGILKGRSGYSTGYMASKEPDIRGKCRNLITAFRTMPPGTPSHARHLSHGERLRNSRYQEFKAQITGDITRDLVNIYPALRGRLEVLESGSPLSCLDYDPPTGSAYGVRCVCGQSRLCGRLPVRNFYIAGQSASVPGVMGTMLTSFIVFRIAVGEEIYRKVIEQSS